MATMDAALAVEPVVEAEEEAPPQYVSFVLGQDRFGLPMSQVVEIVRPPEMVPVPLTPPAFLGLANLRGSVLPVLDLRRLLGLEPKRPDAASRVVVVAMGQPVGLMVDRITRVLAPDESRLEDASAVEGTIDHGLLSGVIKGQEGAGIVQLLELERLLAEHLHIAGREDSPPAAGAVQVPGAGEEETDAEEEEGALQLVSFLLSGQEYAFAIEHVQEIVRLPEEINEVPHAPPHLLGLIELRGRLLPLVGLRRRFGMAEAEADDQNRILVLSTPGGRGAVGVVVDQVREVIQVEADHLDPKPPLLERQGGLEEIAQICRLEEGKRLVSIIEPGALLADPAVRAVAEEGEEEAMSENAEAIQDEEDELAQIVVFGLGNEEYGVLVETVQEITRVPEQMNRVPKTPDFIEGVINLRGTVLPVVDMRSRFGLPRMERSERQRILVLEIGGRRTGFITDAVSEVLRVRRDAIEPAPALSDEQARVLGRVVNLRETGRMIQLLEAEELFDEQQKLQLREV